jgi:transposase
MAKHRTHSIEFKRQVVQEFLSGESLHALAKRHGISRNLIRIWVAKYEAGGLDSDTAAADLLADYEARIAALERLVGKLALENEFLKGASRHVRQPRSASTSVERTGSVAGAAASAGSGSAAGAAAAIARPATGVGGWSTGAAGWSLTGTGGAAVSGTVGPSVAAASRAAASSAAASSSPASSAGMASASLSAPASMALPAATMVVIAGLMTASGSVASGVSPGRGAAGSIPVSPSERGALRVVAPGCRRSGAGAAGVESPPPSSKAANGLDGRAVSAAGARARVARSWFDGTLGGNATRGTGNLGSWDSRVALQSAGHPPRVPNLRDINGLIRVGGHAAGAAWASHALRRQELPGRAGRHRAGGQRPCGRAVECL